MPRSAAKDHVYEWLKEHVARLPKHQGTFLTEKEVSESTGVSRTPVREALVRLEAEGFLQIVPKKGAFVPPITDVDIKAVMQARILIENWCVRHVAAQADSLASQLDELVARQKRLLGRALDFIECDRQFHRTIVQAAGNPVLAEFYESLRDRQVRMGVLAIGASRERSAAVVAEHAAIVDEIRNGNRKVAASAMSTHLGTTLAALRASSVLHPTTDPKGGA